MDEWKLVKFEGINNAIANIVEYQKDLATQKQAIDVLLRKPDVVKREQKIKKITDGIFKDNDKYNTYHDIKLLQEYVDNHTKLMDVKFQLQMNMEELSSYGKLDKNIKSNLFNIPVITLNDVKQISCDGSGFKVRADWKFVSNEEETSDFMIKYVEDDEKEDVMDNDNLVLTKWNVFDDIIINKDSDNLYFSDISTNLSYYVKYRFIVEKMINKPINMLIQSNIKSIKGFKLNLSQQEVISLAIHSHKGHCGSYVPERILQSNDDYYFSPYNDIRDDWIIFSISNNYCYYPTQLQVRARGTKFDVTNGDRYALKRFKLKIGNSERNEWIELNSEIFTASKMNPNLQTFNLDIIDKENDNQIISKWKSIKRKNYKNFKLEILDNYGGIHILIQECKIFGVRI